MRTFASTPPPVRTPWGAPDMATQRVPGIWWVKTPSHGGFALSDERQAAMPKPLRLKNIHYEEDIDWTLVILGFEAEFAALNDPYFDIEQGIAHQIARHWRPQQYGAFTGQVITPSDSYVLKKIELIEAAIGEIGVRSAFGEWADWVPTGKVGLYGQRIVGCDHLGFTQYDGPEFKGLCDTELYEAGRLVNTFAALGVELIS